MKARRLKSIAAILFTVFLLVLAIQGAGKLLNPYGTDDAMNAVRAFHSLPEQSLDVCIFGSSMAWKGVDAARMQNKYGFSAYNYGCNWQRINTTALFISDALSTQTPKVICIDSYHVADVLDNTELNGEIYYTKALPASERKRDYLRKCFGKDPERWLCYYVPLVMFHPNWKSLGKENFRDNYSVAYFQKTRGYNKSKHVYKNKWKDYRSFDQHQLPDASRQILDSIMDMCREKNVEVIFYTTPYGGGEYQYYEAMEKYAKENGCTYLNGFALADEIGIDPKTDFQDMDHLNKSGAGKMADYLGSYIMEHFSV